MIKNSIWSVFMCALGLGVGHAIYSAITKDIISWSLVIDRTFFQFNAMFIYWWITE